MPQITVPPASSYGPADEPRGSQPVAAYGLLADCNSAALVARDGSIDWLCLPRYDSPSVFGRILDPAAGHWSIRPAGAFTSERRYLPGTLVIETTFTTDTGSVRLTDAMLFAQGQRLHDLGVDAPPEPTAPVDVSLRIEDTVEAWRSWEEEHDIYEGPHKELVRLSSRVLKGLTYRPTGAIVAAPTTSLPETVGGERNWDYRYSWIRDASLTLEALYIGSCSDEAEEFVSFMTSSAGGGASLQIMYGIGGEHDLTERELPHLRGWRESTPVRVGNGAWGQTQLDVYGELLNSLYL